MGSLCHSSKKPMQDPSQQKQIIVAFTPPEALIQPHSQNLEDFQANLRATPFRIPVLKQDIRLVYKFERNIGKNLNKTFFIKFLHIFCIFLNFLNNEKKNIFYFYFERKLKFHIIFSFNNKPEF